MHLHEFQAKALLRERGVPVPQGAVVHAAEESQSAMEALGGAPWVVKAQLHSGGRGKVGGVRLLDDADAVRAAVAELIGARLVTHQTGPEGLPVSAVLIEAPTAIARELYLSLLVDRARRRVIVMASAAGGMDIEEVAAKTPEQILSAAVDPATGYGGHVGRRLGFALGLDAAQVKQFDALLGKLYALFMDCDASLIEINPLVVTEGGDLIALDCKLDLDDNALYRHPELAALRDVGQEDAREAEASDHDLNYIRLDGDIGCMVNGAGLAMATMDLIKLHGGRPANFLDVGGGTTAARVAVAFKLILSDPKVRGVLVNIFGGIVRCDLIAEGIIQAVREIEVSVPVVVRLEGTNAEQGRALLAESGLDLTPASGLTEAAEAIVAATQGAA